MIRARFSENSRWKARETLKKSAKNTACPQFSRNFQRFLGLLRVYRLFLPENTRLRAHPGSQAPAWEPSFPTWGGEQFACQQSVPFPGSVPKKMVVPCVGTLPFRIEAEMQHRPLTSAQPPPPSGFVRMGASELADGHFGRQAAVAVNLAAPSGRSRMGANAEASILVPPWDATHTGLRSCSLAGTRPATSPSSGFHHPTLNRRRPQAIPAAYSLVDDSPCRDPTTGERPSAMCWLRATTCRAVIPCSQAFPCVW